MNKNTKKTIIKKEYKSPKQKTKTQKELAYKCPGCQKLRPRSAFFNSATYPGSDYNTWYRRVLICKYCFESRYVICRKCRRHFKKSAIKGNGLCNECYAKAVFCVDCGKELEKFQVCKRGGEIRCAECDAKAFVQQGGKEDGTLLTDVEEVVVFTNKRPCSNHPDSVGCVTAYAVSIEDTQKHPINIYYCSRCDVYYINNTQYLSFAKRYGLPVLNIDFKREQLYGQTDFSEWNTQSILNFFGYNVNANDNLSDAERRRVLVDCIEAQIMSKAQVCSFLESMISLHEYRENFYEANSKWMSDLKYIRNYKINEQRIINARFVFKKR